MKSVEYIKSFISRPEAWQDKHAWCNRSLWDIWMNDYLKYLRIETVDTTRRDCLLKCAESADKQHKLTFAAFLQVLLTTKETGMTSKELRKCTTAGEQLGRNAQQLEKWADAVVDSWKEELYIVEVELQALLSAVSELQHPGDQWVDAAKELLAQWYLYRASLEVLPTPSELAQPPVRLKGETAESYKERLQKYINDIEDDESVCNSTSDTMWDSAGRTDSLCTDGASARETDSLPSLSE
jgi:hypothetical protein